jgi:predicted acetyltransferase
MPEYRAIPPEDYERASTINYQAFRDDPAVNRRWLASERPTELRGLYADGRLVSQLELWSFDLLDGRGAIACGGFGAVATPPEERRRGYVGQLLAGACAELRERGAPLIILGPFKESFYGQFGWAAFCERRRYIGAPGDFASFRQQAGRFEHGGAESIAELDSIYRQALRGRFGVVARSADWWQKCIVQDAYWQRSQDVYIWRDASGSGRAYTLYRIVQEGEKRTLRCREMVALDPEARAQLFGFLANHDSQADEIVFYGPTDAPVNLLFPNPLRCEVEPFYMLRVIDLVQALERFHYPRECRGRLTLAVRDSWLAHNQGSFALEVEGGTGRCERLADDAPAQLACDIRVLAPILSRHLRPRTAAAFGMLEAHDRAALGLLEQLLAGLAPFFSEAY